MKTLQKPKYASVFNQASSEQPVRLIKAAQAAKLLDGASGASHGTTGVHKKPEIRMIHAGTDYCDLEITCGCGESTQVRCWNTPADQEKAVA